MPSLTAIFQGIQSLATYAGNIVTELSSTGSIGTLAIASSNLTSLTGLSTSITGLSSNLSGVSSALATISSQITILATSVKSINNNASPLNIPSLSDSTAWNTASSATFKMLGYGATVTLTPLNTGRIYIKFGGTLNCLLSSAATGFMQLRFGTGTAPTTSSAASGTLLTNSNGINLFVAPGNTGQFGTPYEISGVASLSAGTAYWFDLALSTLNVALGVSLTQQSAAVFEF
jgi:hypothetical protein